MLWPGRIDYTQAVGNFPHISVLDPILRGGTPRRGTSNYPIVYSGGFSTVFPVEVLSNTYALRCWIADIGDAETRYQEISDYLKQCRLPYFVDFAYVPEGILVNGTKYPITRMEWAEGETLCGFIKHNLQDAGCLKTAAAEFQKMVETLHIHQIAHGDFQDGNILLKRNGTDVEIKLIDYDSLFVPALRGQPDNIVGLPEYQHPQRIAGGGGANEKMDYFSELVIYLSLLSLAEKPDLWSQFGDRTEKGVLFTAEDFRNPDQSNLFRELENLSSDVKRLASKLKESCKRSVDQLEPLEAILAYNQGLAYLQNSRYNEAVVEFEKAIDLDPNYKEAHYELGLAHLQMGNLGEAKKAAEAALRIDSYYQPAHQLLDAITRKSRDWSVPPPPPVPPGRIFLKSVFNFWQYIAPNLWQYITATLAFVLLLCIVTLATQLSAKDESLRQIGVLTNQQVETGSELHARTSSIRKLLDQKAQLLLENQTLRNQLTEQEEETKTQFAISQQLRNEKEEIRSQNQILQNENVRLREQLDEQHSSLNPFSRDDERFRMASPQKIYSIPRIVFPERGAAIYKNNLGCDAFDNNQYSEAIEFFDDAIRSAPQSAVVHYNLGCTYLAMNRYDKAVNYLNRAVVLNPRFKEAHYNLALAFLRRGYQLDHHTAINVVQEALQIDRHYQPARQLLEAIEQVD